MHFSFQYLFITRFCKSQNGYEEAGLIEMEVLPGEKQARELIYRV